MDDYQFLTYQLSNGPVLDIYQYAQLSNRINGTPNVPNINTIHSQEINHNPNYPNYRKNIQYPQVNRQLNEQASSINFPQRRQMNQIKSRFLPQLRSLNPDNIHHLKVKAAQNQAIRHQQQVNSQRRRKQKQNMLIENEMIIRNQIQNYPYGNIHSEKINKIIQKKRKEDKNNQDILMKFQREAEQFKKSKSKHIKNMLAQQKQNEFEFQKRKDQAIFQDQQCQIQNKQSSVLVFQKKNQQNNKPSILKQRSKVKVRFTDNIENKDPYSDFNNQVAFKNNKIQFEALSPSKSRIKKANQFKIPITDNGQDGLMFIRKNIESRSRCQRDKISSCQDQNQQHPYSQRQQIKQINDSLSQLSMIIQSNKAYLSSERTPVSSKKYKQQQSIHEIKKRSKANQMINPLKMRNYLQRLKNNDDSGLKQHKQYLEYLSSVLD